MSAPERIWAWPWEVNPRMGQWEAERSIAGDGWPYVPEAALAAAQAEIARLTAERDAAMAGPICDITETDMGNIVAHLSYDLEPQGPLPNRNSLMMEVVRLSNRLATPQPAPQAREITVQEAAGVLLGDHAAIACRAEGIHDGPLMADDHWFRVARPQGLWCVDAVRAALRAIAAMQKEPTHDQP